MDIRIHIGVHRTASKHLQMTLDQNAELFEEQGICIPNRKLARKSINEAAGFASGGGDIVEIQEQLIEKLTEGRIYDRLVITNEYLSGNMSRPFGKELFYPRIRDNMNKLTALFVGLNVRLFASVRNPATFIPSCFVETVRSGGKETFQELITDTNLQGLRWSNYLHRAQGQSGDTAMTVWRYEDYPMIWRDVVQAITKIENKEVLEGSIEPVNRGLSFKGGKLLTRFLEKNPTIDHRQRKALLREFARMYPSYPEEVIGVEWPQELVEGMSENYEDDWYYIERMDNIYAITPREYP